MADTYNIEVTRGSSFDISITARDANELPINLSGYSISGFVKNKYSDTGVLLNLSPSGVLPLASGVVNIYLTPSQTVALPVTSALYDVEMRSGTYCLKIINGRFDIFPEVKA